MALRRASSLLPAPLALAMTLLVAREALAQSPDPDAEKRAKPLFDEAAAELDRGQYDTACPKLEKVTQMVPEGVGAKETLAECYEKQGKLASAWRQYTAAEEAARRQNKPDRAKAAAKHAAALKPKLSTLTVEGPAATPGADVTLDGAALDSSQWNVALPVDAGEHTIAVTARAHRPFSKTVTVAGDRAAVLVTVPPLEPSAPSGPVSPPPSSIDGRLIGGIALTVGGVAGLAVGVVSSLQVADAQKALEPYRDIVPVGRDVCAADPPASPPPQVQEACSRAVFVPLQFVFYGVGAVAGGVGAYLIATSGKKPEAAAMPKIVPAIGPGHASLTLRWVF